MKTLTCSKCKSLKSTSEFTPRKTPRGFNSWCKLCNSSYNTNKRHDGFYSVYYLVNEHYCGYTKNLERRIKDHNRDGKDCSEIRLLYTSKNKIEAAHHEAMFQSYLGMGGLNITGHK